MTNEPNEHFDEALESLDEMTAEQFMKVLEADHEIALEDFHNAEFSIAILDIADSLPQESEEHKEFSTLIRRYAEMCKGLAAQKHADLHMLMEAMASLTKDMEKKK